MLINLISFLNPLVYAGGGEMISRRLIEVGNERGHDIRISSVRPNKMNLHKKPDLSFFIDLFNHGHTIQSLGAWRGFNQSLIESILKQGPFVHMTNAYVDVCNLPYLPCSGNGRGECPAKPVLTTSQRIVLRDWGNSCFAQKELVKKLYTQSLLNIYLSPLHQKITESLLDTTDLPKSYLLKPMIDTSRFFNEQNSRDIDYLFVGVIGEAKGLNEMRERFGNTDIHMIGKCADGAKLDFGQYLGHVSYDEIPKYMNRAKNFVFLPRWPEPQGRVVAEAALCGCNIIGNDNVGALSFGADLSNPITYEGIEDNFWIKLESLV